MGGEGVRPSGFDARASLQPKGNLEAPDQFRDKLRGAAQENDLSLDRPSACKPGDRLAHDRLKGTGCNVAFLRTRIQKRAHVGLREHSAARGDGVDARGTSGKPAHIARSYAEHKRDRVDKPACPACAGGVHSLLGVAGKVHHLRVFPAEFDDGVGIGVKFPHGALRAQNLLYEGKLKHVDKRDSRRSGDGRLAGQIAVAPNEVVQNIDERFADVRKMAPVDRVHDSTVLVDDHDLDSLRPRVDSETVCHRRALIYRE